MSTGVSAVLQELNRLRRHLRELRQEIERLPQLLKARQARLARQEQEARDAQEQLKRLKVRLHEQEVTLKSTHQMIAKWEKQLDTIANKKEYDALQAEIAHARQRCAELEDEILAGMAEAEERAARLPELEGELTRAREEVARHEQEAQERRDRLAAEVALAERELREQEQKLPISVRPQYDRLVTAFGDSALAPVENKACSHCHSTVTLQQTVQLEGGSFITCNSCGRGLYLPG